jgi:hypothetical protein
MRLQTGVEPQRWLRVQSRASEGRSWTEPQLEAAIRRLLAQVDPQTGYIE